MRTIGLIGGQTGKLGNVVFYQRAGETLGRAYQPIVSNPDTARQQMARARFRLLSAYAKRFRPAIELGLAAAASKRQSARNLFMSLNNEVLNGSTIESLSLDYESVQLSKGGFYAVAFGTPDFTEPLTVVVPISSSTLFATELTEEVSGAIVLAGYCADMEECCVTGSVVSYQDSVPTSVKLVIPNQWQGMRVHVYGFCKAVPESHLAAIPTATEPWRYPGESSDSAYIGIGTIA